MGLFDFLKRIFGGRTVDPQSASRDPHSHQGQQSTGARAEAVSSSPTAPRKQRRSTVALERPRKRVRLEPLNYESSLIPTPVSREIVDQRPYRFAFPGPSTGKYLDLSQDCDQRWLEYYNLPSLKTPDELAAWLQVPIGKLAWLTHRTDEGHRPQNESKAHYCFRWLKKRSGGWRLIESPKSELKRIQQQILREILDRVPPHQAAHGFVRGRSILTNASPHLGKRFVLEFDLESFYPSVRYSRVVAIFRSLGYSREVGIWLARLTTNSLPFGLKFPGAQYEYAHYVGRHLPQGAATSPALANLSAFGLDVRLSGLAEAYGLTYTRYADDLTLSGPATAIPALREIIPLVRRIIRSERFVANESKRRVIRNSQRQVVTGVVVNQKPNVARRDFDRLKAILHNCIKHGPSTQNRDARQNFPDHLRGRIAHVQQLNAKRGEKLLALFARINWSR